MKRETKWNKAKAEIIRTLPFDEKEAKTSKEVATGLEFDINRTYVANLLMQMAKEGVIYHKRTAYKKGFCYWYKEIIHKKKTKAAKIEQYVFTVLTSLKYDETMNVREIVEQMLHWKMNCGAKHVSPVMSKMYCNGIVKRSKILYKNGYYYWLEGDEREKNIRGVPRQRKSVIKAETTTTDDRLKHANELHNLNVSLRELIGKYRNNNKELKRMVDSRDKEIEQQKSRITTLELELQNISTEQDVAKDIYKSRKLLEHTFK